MPRYLTRFAIFFKSCSTMRLVPTISRRAITWVSGKVIHFRQLWSSNLVFWRKKNELLRRKSLLSRKTNQPNGYPIYIKERSPRHQNLIFDIAKAENMITTTVNCKVKVFEESDDGLYRGVEVNSKKLSLTWETKLSKRNQETMPQLQHPLQLNQAAETTIHWNVAERHLEICQPRKPKINVTRMTM